MEDLYLQNWLSSDENRGTKRRILRIYDDDDDNDENSSQGMEYSQDATASRLVSSLPLIPCFQTKRKKIKATIARLYPVICAFYNFF